MSGRKEVIKRIKETKATLDSFPEFVGDSGVVAAAIKNDGHQLRYASDDLKADKKLVNAAVEKEPRALEHAAEKLRNNKTFMFEHIKKNNFLARYLGSELSEDKDYGLMLMRKLGTDILGHLSETLLDNREFLFSAISLDKHALKHASEKLRNDREVVLASMRWGDTEAYIGKKLRNDPSFVKHVIEKNLVGEDGDFDWLGDKLKGSEEFMYEQAPKLPKLLAFAAKPLRTSKQFLLKFDPEHFKRFYPYLDDDLKTDPFFMRELLEQCPELSKRVPKRMRKEIKKLRTAK